MSYIIIDWIGNIIDDEKIISYLKMGYSNVTNIGESDTDYYFRAW